MDIYQFNDAVIGTGSLQSRRPYPQWAGINYTEANGTSSVEGLLARVEHRPGPEGLTAILSYTWLNEIDTVGGRLNTPGDSRYISVNLPVALNRGLGEGNVPGRLVPTVGYDFPFGRGKSMLTNGLVGQIIGGWSVFSLIQYQRGPWVTPDIPYDYLNVGSNASQRPDVLQNPNLDSGQTPQRWFNTTAFVLPPTTRYGDAGRSIIQAPNLFSTDILLSRSFRFRESLRLELRGEAFNVTNHTNFGLPGLDYGTATFGVITSALESRYFRSNLGRSMELPLLF